MEKKIVVLAWAICLFGLSACGSTTPETWRKEGGTQAGFNVDRYACLQQSQQMSGSALGNMASLEAVTNKEIYYACLGAHGWVYVNPETVAPPRITQMPVLPAPASAPGASQAQAPWPTVHMNLPPPPAEKSSEVEIKVADMNLPISSEEKTLCSKSEFTEILARTPCTASAVTSSYIADKTKLQDVDRPALAKLISAKQLLARQQIDTVTRSGKPFNLRWAAAMEHEFTRASLNVGALNSGLITWGEFNKIRRQDFEAYLIEYATIPVR